MLTSIKLNNFRSYDSYEFEFSEGVNLVVGHNAIGKTNLLEAVHLLGIGESFRAKRTEEMVRFDQEVGRVSGIVQLGKDDSTVLEVLVNGGVS